MPDRPPTATEDRPFDGPIHRHWRDAAATKGFEIVARIRDRYHLRLRCRSCGGEHVAKLFVLMNTTPACPACTAASWQRDAEAAGVTHLGQDTADPHYGRYRFACGHEGRRQMALIRRVAAGETGLRCEICLNAREAAEARDRGWELIGTDPQGDPSYRLYRHGCGQDQRVARANMQTGRFNCARCGEGWSAAGSEIYLMRFALADGDQVIKVGYSRDPVSRLRYQLKRDRDLRGWIRRTVRIASGHEAVKVEKGLHSLIRRHFPQAVIPPARYAEQLRVKSEIYSIGIEGTILALFDAIEARIGGPSGDR